MPIAFFNNTTDNEKKEFIKELIEQSSPRRGYFLMIGLSIIMATAGLLLDSVEIIIGSMLIAPLLYALLALALGLVIFDGKVIGRAVATIIKSTLLSVALAWLATIILEPADFQLNDEILSRGSSSLLYAVVALIAGIAASYSFIKPQLNEKLAGIAIAVALIPPLAVIGIGIARLNWWLIQGSLTIFLTNIIGIVVASVVVFSLADLHTEKRLVNKELKQDDKEIEKEKK